MNLIDFAEWSPIKGNLAVCVSLHSSAKCICSHAHRQPPLCPPEMQLLKHYVHCTVNWSYNKFLSGFSMWQTPAFQTWQSSIQVLAPITHCCGCLLGKLLSASWENPQSSSEQVIIRAPSAHTLIRSAVMRGHTAAGTAEGVLLFAFSFTCSCWKSNSSCRRLFFTGHGKYSPYLNWGGGLKARTS